MQIHELNAFLGALDAGTFLAVDDGDDTGRLSVEALLRTVNERIDNIITSPAPTEQEIIDARRGWNEVVYSSLGAAIRSQVKQILAQFYKFNTYDLLAVYGTPISRTRNGVTFTWDDAGQVCEVTGEAVGGDAYASIYTQTGAWPGIFEHGVVYTIGYETTDPNVKLRIAVWEGIEPTPDYYYFDENGYFGIPPEAAKIAIDLYVASGDAVSAVVKNVYMLRTYTAAEVTATIRDAMIGADRHMYNSLGDAIREQLNGKVDKVTGKVLSSNDFTDADKTKLDDIEAGAEVNAIEAVKLDGTELTPDENRAVDIPVDETLTVEGVPADAKTVGEGLESKLAIDGYSELATVGNAEQLVATQHITDTEPYIYRKTGGPNDVGDRVYDTLVGGSVVWNQLAQELSDTYWGTSYQSGISGTSTYADGVRTVHLDESTGGVVSINIGANHRKTTIAGHKYLFSATLKTTNGQVNILPTGVIADGSKGWASFPTRTRVDYIWGATEEKALYFTIRGYTGSGVTSVIDFTAENAICIDLTAALTPTIADYIYTLEQATAGAGVAWFKKYFPGIYYGYCEPHFEHVQTSAKCTVGFNQFDKNASGVQTGKYLDANCDVKSLAGVSLTDYIPVIGGTSYYWTQTASASVARYWWWFDENKAPISGDNTRLAAVRVAPSNACYLRVSVSSDYWDEFNVNIHGDRDGEYEPYRKRTYPIEPKVLRGYPTLDASNNLRFDGDTYTHDGTITRKRHLVDLGTLNYVRVQVNGVYMFRTYSQGKRGIIPGYVSGTLTALGDKEFVSSTSYWDSTLRLAIRNDAYTTAADFKTAMSGVYIEADLAEPTTETAEPFQSPMVVDPLGTEEFIDYGVEQGTRDVSIVVGHSSEYPADLRGKLQHLPSLSTSGDGRYVVVQTGNQMTLSPDTSLGLIAALEARVAALEGGNG